MSNITFIWRDIQIFKNRYQDKHALLYKDYCKKISDSIEMKIPNIKYFDFDVFELNANIAGAVDLIIAEDNVDTIINLTRNALECASVNNIIICDDLSTLEKILTLTDITPKVLTLDFMFKNIESVHLNIINETLKLYKKLKLKWPLVPVLGITNHSKDLKVAELLQELQKNGDEYYNKVSIYDALPDILRNRIEYFKLDNLGASKVRKESLGELVADMNTALIKKGIDLEKEKMANTIAELLDLQEKALAFIFNNDIKKYKSTTLAAAMLYCKADPDAKLTSLLFTRLNTTSKQVYNEYNLPSQPLASVQKYFQAIGDNDIITKEALIILELLRKYPGDSRWPLSIEKGKLKDLASPIFLSFLDNIFALIKQFTFITL